MIAALALIVALAQSAVHLTIHPWTGSDLQTASSDAVKYRLEVAGKPGAAVRLTAHKVATGWIAAFCTPKVCSPGQVALDLPDSGGIVLQFELIREAADAPHHTGATITETGGASVIVPAAAR